MIRSIRVYNCLHEQIERNTALVDTALDTILFHDTLHSRASHGCLIACLMKVSIQHYRISI